MITYRDMTFCSGAGCQSFDKCFRALTPKVIAEAKAWMPGLSYVPVSQFVDPVKNECYVPPISK